MDVQTISSAQNPVARTFRLTASGKISDLILIEGRHLLEEALKADWPLHTVLIRDDLWPGWSASLEGLAGSVRLCVAPARLIDRLSTLSSSEGLLALGRRPQYALPDAPGTDDFFLCLEGVQDPVNVGILLRSAVAFGAAGVMVCEGTCDPFRLTALFRSSGAAFHVPVVFCRTADLLDWADARGVGLVAAAADGDAVGSGSPPDRPLALVVGNEGRGISSRVVDRCRRRIGIPMVRGWDSLNVAAAGSILMHALSELRG